MKRFLSFLTVALLVCFLVILGGCNNAEQTENNKFTGSWQATMDYTDAIDAKSMFSGSDLEDYIEIGTLTLKCDFVFNEDNTCKLSLNKKSIDKMYDDLIGWCEDGLEKWLGEYITQMGLDTTPEQMMKEQGVTIQMILGDDFTRKDFAELFDDDLWISGRYKAQNGMLYIAEDADDDFDDFLSYSFDGKDSFKLELPVDELDEDIAPFFPMTFVRQ